MTSDSIEHELSNLSCNNYLESSVQKDLAFTDFLGNGYTNTLNGSIKKDCHIPFPLLTAEVVKEYSLSKENYVVLTNYRLFVCYNQCFSNVPVYCVDYVEMRELLALYVNCKDGKIIRVAFDTQEDCSQWWRHITSSEFAQTNPEDLFAYQHFLKLPCKPPYDSAADLEAGLFVDDVRRMGFNTKSIWRISEINSKFEVCKTYPKFHIVPKWISDDDLKTVAQFRALRRFPSVVWRSKKSGAIIARSSQPELGWFGWRCEKDEQLLSAISQAASLDRNNKTFNMTVSVTDMSTTSKQPFLLVDARSYASAVANRAKGGGCECQEYYPNCDIQFMNLPNIHVIRKSFQSVRTLCYLGKEQLNWYSSLENTRWLQYLSALLRATLTIVESIDVRAQSVLVHCSDGWDRTTQIVSLSELLLDPYYRTIKGFHVLIEREWLEFGHKFADRCGHSQERDINEKSPVFLQWLDAVYQLIRQFPSAFEFNEFFLVKLVQHVYSCLYGTFLCNSTHDRHNNKVKSKTLSLWDMLLSCRKDFINYIYTKETKVLYPSYHIKDLRLWESVFTTTSHQYSKTSIPQKDLVDLSQLELNDSGNFTANGESCKEPNGFITSYSSAQQLNNSSNNETFITQNGHSMNVNYCKKNKSFANNDANILSIADLNESNDWRIIENIDEIKESANEPLDNYINRDKFLYRDSEDDLDNSENENIDTPKMTDSVRTITNENERRKSLDESFKPLQLDSNLTNLSRHGSGVIRRAHSSPESPPLSSMLSRTKSFPDVMSSSMGASDGKVNSNQKNPFQKDLSKFLDTDGLTVFYCFYDQQLMEIAKNHTQEINRIFKKLEQERQARIYLQHQNFQNGSPNSAYNLPHILNDDQLSLPDSVNGTRSSLSSVSNEEGWEQVQYDDVQPVRWIPDHLSSFCSSCGCRFSVLYRRHHCRKCGGIFCDGCSKYQISIPEESLFNPVRVCARCYIHSSVVQSTVI